MAMGGFAELSASSICHHGGMVLSDMQQEALLEQVLHDCQPIVLVVSSLLTQCRAAWKHFSDPPISMLPRAALSVNFQLVH
jgi:hypothetical protein